MSSGFWCLVQLEFATLFLRLFKALALSSRRQDFLPRQGTGSDGLLCFKVWYLTQQKGKKNKTTISTVNVTLDPRGGKTICLSVYPLYIAGIKISMNTWDKPKVSLSQTHFPVLAAITLLTFLRRCSIVHWNPPPIPPQPF